MNETSFKINTADLQELLASDYFDPEWYLDRYPDVRLAEMDPAEHFLWLGGRLGRNPSPRFDTKAYLAANPAVSVSGVNPLLHFLRKDRAVSETTPHYGKVFTSTVEDAAALTKSADASEEYKVVRTEFDIAYYLMRNRDVARAAKLDPILHYIRNGWRQGRDPSANFSTKRYLARYPEVEASGLNPFYHWLTVGRAKGYIAEAFEHFEEVCDMLNRSPAETQHLLQEKRNDLRARLEHGALGEMVAKASEYEPLIAHSWPDAMQVGLPPFSTEYNVNAFVALFRLQRAVRFRRFDYVIVVNRPRWGGGIKAEGYLSRALLKIFPDAEILIVYSEEGGEAPPNRFPDKCVQIDFASAAQSLQSRYRHRVFLQFLRSLRPAAIFNVNSRSFWEVLAPYGQALSSEIPLYAYLFCNEQTRLGFWTGYPVKYFYRHFDKLSGVLVDSRFLKEELEKLYRVPELQHSSITVLSAPVNKRIQPVRHQVREGRPKVYWAGRFDRQKRLDVVYEIARIMPDVDFHLWGKPMLDGYDMERNRPDNVHLEGVYNDFMELPLDRCSAWLYTSEWDGVPHLLLEVAMTGIPLVGSLVGGNEEVLVEEMSWRITDFENPFEYEAALREVLSDPAAARNKAGRLRECMISRRTADNYTKSVADAMNVVVSA